MAQHRCPGCSRALTPHCQRTEPRPGSRFPKAKPCPWGTCQQCNHTYRLQDMRVLPDRGSEIKE